MTTVEDMVWLMEDKSGKAKRVWVMDRAMVSEENLDFLRERGAYARAWLRLEMDRENGVASPDCPAETAQNALR